MTHSSISGTDLNVTHCSHRHWWLRLHGYDHSKVAWPACPGTCLRQSQGTWRLSLEGPGKCRPREPEKTSSFALAGQLPIPFPLLGGCSHSPSWKLHPISGPEGVGGLLHSTPRTGEEEVQSLSLAPPLLSVQDQLPLVEACEVART